MFDPACTLLHKCLLNIIPSSHMQGAELLNTVLTCISVHIKRETGLVIPAAKLLGNFTSETQDRQHRLIVSYIQTPDTIYPIHWALRIKSGDPTARYRTYAQHIGLKQTSAYEVSVHIGSTSTDHLGGRFTTFHPPLKKVSPLVERLFSNADIRCITGNHVLLNKSIKLTNQSIEYFLNLVYEKTRTLPVILITCPDIVDPELLHSRLLGNAIVCYTGDPDLITLVNEYLPEALRVSFGSIRIYVPFDMQAGSAVFHPVIPLSDVYRINPNEVVNTLSRAYAENFRQQELRSFVTIETCADLKTRQHISSLKKQLTIAMEEKKIAESALQKLQASMENMNSGTISNNPIKSNEEYESLLGEYTAELDLIKDGLQYLMAQTCGNQQIIDVPVGAHALVIDLIKSVNFRQMRPRSATRKSLKQKNRPTISRIGIPSACNCMCSSSIQ